nr:CapA family protein [Paenibacillus pini]
MSQKKEPANSAGTSEDIPSVSPSEPEGHKQTEAVQPTVNKPETEKKNEAPVEKDKVASKTNKGSKTNIDVSSNKTEEKDNSSKASTTGSTTDGKSLISSGPEKKVLIQFAGDMIFSGKVEDQLEKNGYSYPFDKLGNLFQKDDLTLANLETPVTTRGVGAKNKQFVFKSSPLALDALHAAGMDVVNLANNHILDQGIEGLLDTISYLDSSGIKYVGAGKNKKSAYEPEYVNRNGITIAVLGFTRVSPETSWFAGSSNPGVAQLYEPSQALKSVAEARKKADLVIVMTHWGIERSLKPNDNQQMLAHSLVDAGADLIIGGHPHVLQGMEQYKGKWIAYSTGNFIFTKSSTPATWKTAVFQARCSTKTGCGLKMIPYKAELGQPVPMQQQEGQQLLREMQGLSIGGVRIAPDGTISAK